MWSFQEKEELIEEWTPEPLVPQSKPYDADAIDPRVVEGWGQQNVCSVAICHFNTLQGLKWGKQLVTFPIRRWQVGCSVEPCYPFHSWAQKVYSPNLSKSDCMSDEARICSIITFHLSKLWKVKFSILCDVIFLVRLQGNFDIDHSQEWKG